MACTCSIVFYAHTVKYRMYIPHYPDYTINIIRIVHSGVFGLYIQYFAVYTFSNMLHAHKIF